METVDLGQGFSLTFFGWHPDRELNPQYANLPDIELVGASLICRHGNEGALLFNHAHREVFPGRSVWDVTSWAPLTLTPSIQMPCCHGVIMGGKWIDA